MGDPRVSVIDERLRHVKRIIAVSSGKGGVGKSLVSCALALSLVKKGFRVGLFDLDFTSPSTHVILGVKGAKPKEDMGIVPPIVYDLKYMSLIYYSGELAAPLRGADVSNALIELLAITRWGELDYLVIDMPPGIGDATLDLIRLIKRIEFLIVTTSSVLAFETIKKLVGLLRELKVPVVGLVENMKRDKASVIGEETEGLGVKFLGEIPFDEKLESALGNANLFFDTVFAVKVREFTARI